MRYKKILLFSSFFLFLFFSLLFSQTKTTSEGKDGIFTTKLDNGLEIIAIENHTVPLVTISIAVKNGAYTEPPEYNGLSHLYEHMFFKGNKAIPNQEAYMERQRELGMVWNGGTSTEYVNYYFNLSKDSLLPGLIFMKDAIETPLFNQAELEKEREVVLGEYDRNEATPSFHLDRAIGKKLWFKYFSRKNVIGDREVIKTATREKMITIQKRYYIPNNSALIVEGDIDHQQIFDLAKKLFSDWKRGPDPFKEFPIPVQPSLSKSEAVIVDQPVKTITLQIEWQGPSISQDTKSTYAADVFSYILSQDNSSFQKNLVESGLALYCGINYYTQEHTGPISITAQTTPDKLLELNKAIMQEVSKFDQDDYFSDNLLQYAKNKLAVDDIYNRETGSDFALNLGFWWCSAGIDYYLNYVDNLKKVTREDIKKYVDTYIKDKPYVIGVMLSSENQTKLNLKPEDLL
ncbi:MAG TPA: pitrilysin family protein [Terriglobales bacterium]|nr:pitrilysin family protein [Terriglobales bacterium]